MTSVTQEKSELTLANETFKKQIEALNSKLNEYQTQLNERELTLTNLNKDKSDLAKNNQTLKQQIETLNSSLAQIDVLKGENERVKKDLEAAVAEKEKLASEIEAFKNDSGAKDVVDQLQKELTEALDKLAELEEK